MLYPVIHPSVLATELATYYKFGYKLYSDTYLFIWRKSSYQTSSLVKGNFKKICILLDVEKGKRFSLHTIFYLLVDQRQNRCQSNPDNDFSFP